MSSKNNTKLEHYIAYPSNSNDGGDESLILARIVMATSKEEAIKIYAKDAELIKKKVNVIKKKPIKSKLDEKYLEYYLGFRCQDDASSSEDLEVFHAEIIMAESKKIAISLCKNKIKEDKVEVIKQKPLMGKKDNTLKYFIATEANTGNREEANVYYSQLIIAKNKKEALKIYLKETSDEEDEVDIIEMKPLTR